MNVRQLEIFCSVMETGSVSDAARLLGVSQPAVSKALRLMQHETGLVLFRRVGSSLHPSSEADQIYARARGLLADIDRLGEYVTELRDLHAGRLRVATLATLGTTFIPGAVSRLRERRPQVEVEVQALPSRQVVDLLVRNEVDVGVFHEPADDPKVRTEEICETELVCVLPRDHPLAERKHIEAADLAGENLISFAGDSSVAWMLHETFRTSPRPVEPAIVVNQTVIAFALVSGGAGLALVDPFPLFGSAFSGIVARPIHPTIRLRVRVAFPRERPVSRLAHEFAAILRRVAEERVAISPFRLEMIR